MDRWELLDDEATGPDGAYFYFSDSQNWTADEQAAIERLLAEANAAAVYRKALEPAARAYAARGLMFGEVPVGEDWKADITEACRLMGLLPATEDAPPEHTASAEEAFEGKSDEDTIDLMQALKDSLRAIGKGAKE